MPKCPFSFLPLICLKRRGIRKEVLCQFANHIQRYHSDIRQTSPAVREFAPFQFHNDIIEEGSLSVSEPEEGIDIRNLRKWRFYGSDHTIDSGILFGIQVLPEVIQAWKAHNWRIILSSVNQIRFGEVFLFGASVRRWQVHSHSALAVSGALLDRKLVKTIGFTMEKPEIGRPNLCHRLISDANFLTEKCKFARQCTRFR
jgi:hypothetical protein